MPSSRTGDDAVATTARCSSHAGVAPTATSTALPSTLVHDTISAPSSSRSTCASLNSAMGRASRTVVEPVPPPVRRGRGCGASFALALVAPHLVHVVHTEERQPDALRAVGQLVRLHAVHVGLRDDPPQHPLEPHV